MAPEQHTRPTALVLTRPLVPTLDRAIYPPAELLRRAPFGWERWTILGIDRFGAWPDAVPEYGFTVGHVVGQALGLVERAERAPG